MSGLTKIISGGWLAHASERKKVSEILKSDKGLSAFLHGIVDMERQPKRL